ncbi:MAG: EFR1 family ferrodoxin [Bacteroidales bacterium]|nr:EFR1 family ferrodoxin [Bacteroidales bacterium]
MILYFSGTGNSLAIARKLADATGEALLPLRDAAERDLTAERTVGLVYPCYDYNTPPAVREFVSRLRLSPEAYVFIVVTCGAQTGNSIHTVRRLVEAKGVRVDYCHKVRMPDNSATLFGRNPNDQLWKLDKYAPRVEQIIGDIKARRHGRHFAAPGLAGTLAGLPAVERKLLGGFKPSVLAEHCIGCGKCIKTCPVGNIAMDDNGKAAIGDRCTACVACLHTCPQQAIGVRGKRPPMEHQYHYPAE